MFAIDCGSSDSDLDDIDIENMLDEGLPDDLREHKKQQHYEEKYKTILDGNGKQISWWITLVQKTQLFCCSFEFAELEHE